MASPSRPPHDPFAKALIQQAIGGFGHVETSHEIESGTLVADLWFVPQERRRGDVLEVLSLWRKQCATPCLIEVFSTTPGAARIKDVVVKAGFKERALRDNDDQIVDLHLWILTPGVPESALASIGDRLRRGERNARQRCVGGACRGCSCTRINSQGK